MGGRKGGRQGKGGGGSRRAGCLIPRTLHVWDIKGDGLRVEQGSLGWRVVRGGAGAGAGGSGHYLKTLSPGYSRETLPLLVYKCPIMRGRRAQAPHHVGQPKPRHVSGCLPPGPRVPRVLGPRKAGAQRAHTHRPKSVNRRPARAAVGRREE